MAGTLLGATSVLLLGIWLLADWRSGRFLSWHQLWRVGWNPDVLKTSFSLAAFVGATLAAVYGYRKQRVLEGDARRSDDEQMGTRYTNAAEQLGSEKVAVRLAGVHAMARLADDWADQRQTCIDVLCAYLRMSSRQIRTDESPGGDLMESEVCSTIVRLFAKHLSDDAACPWSSYDLDFTGAVFTDADFFGARFDRGVRFDRTKFMGGNTSFEGCTFSASASFQNATFNGVISFIGTVMPYCSFQSATFNGMAMFVGARIGRSFDKAAFDVASFHRADFPDGADFKASTFRGVTSFADAVFGGPSSFDDASFIGKANFDRSTFHKAVTFRNTTSIEHSFDHVTFSVPMDAAAWPLFPSQEQQSSQE